MDHSTQQLIDKFKRNPAIAQSLLQSGDGQRLMQMLTMAARRSITQRRMPRRATRKSWPQCSRT